MHRRQFMGLLASASLAGAVIPGCARETPLRVGMIHWIGYEPLFLAKEFGWLGDSVALTRTASGSETITGLLNGSLDAGGMTLDEALRVSSQGVPLTVIAVMNVSAGADAVMVRPEITGLRDLKGRRVAVELQAVSAVMLLKVLEEAGLTRADIEEFDLPVDQHAQAWRRNEIDASVSYEPMASVLESLGAKRLFDSRSLPETIFDVLVVRRDRISQRKGALRSLLVSHFRGLNHLVRNFHDAVYRVATRQEVTPEAVRHALGTVTLPDLSTNQRYLAPEGQVDKAAENLQALLLKEGLMAQSVDLDRLCNASFLPRSPV